jgi:phosphoribosylglycinamide formyltransferase-1
MYGDAVHRAVIAHNERESGITIHYVNKHYDNGDIIFQARCRVNPKDTPESLATRIHELEYLHYPRIIEELVMRL